MLRKLTLLLLFLIICNGCAAQCSGASKDLSVIEVRSKEYPAESILCELIVIYCRKKGDVITAAENDDSFKACLNCDDINYILLKSGDERYDGKDKCKLSEIQNQRVYLPLKPEFIRQRNTFLAGVNAPARTK